MRNKAPPPLSYPHVAPIGIALLFAIASSLLVVLSIYVIGHEHRWTWGLQSPNDLGALAAAVGCACTAIVSVSRPTSALNLLVVFMAIIATTALTASGSRGAWVGFTFGIVVLACTLRTKASWLICGSALASLAISVAFVPKSHARLTNLSVSIEGGSIGVHIETWKRTLGIVGDSPWLGTGSFSFLEYYRNWYEVSPREFSLAHPMNDFLNVCCRLGLPVATVILGVFLTLIVVHLRWSRSTSKPASSACSAAFVSLVVTGLFTSLLRSPIAWIFGALIMAGGIAIMVSARTPWVILRSSVLIGFGSSVFIGIATFLAGLSIASSLSYIPSPTSQLPRVNPRGMPASSVLYVIADPGDPPGVICRNVLRAAASAGYAATLIQGDANLLVSATSASDSSSGKPVFLLYLSGSTESLLPDGGPAYSPPQTSGLIFCDLQDDRIVLPINLPVLIINGTEKELPTSHNIRSAIPPNQAVIAKISAVWPRSYAKYGHHVLEWCELLKDPLRTHQE